MERISKLLDDAKSILGQTPRWALIMVAIVGVAVAGEVVYLIVESGGEGGKAGAEESLPCNDIEAENAVVADRFAQEVRDLGTVPPLSRVEEVYDVDVIGCADLTEDDVDEMVVGLNQRAAPSSTSVPPPVPWAIYRVQGNKWVPSLIRTHVPVVEVTLDRGVVTERSPALLDGDALCCPGGQREGVAKWDGEEFKYSPDMGPRGRTIAIVDGEARALAGFDLVGGSLPDAIELFGAPTTWVPQGDVCPASWADLGLTIEFANFGGLDPCGVEGRVGSASVVGLEARQAGWQTQEGATVDISDAELKDLYPELQPAEEATTFVPGEPEGDLFTLVARPSSIAAEGSTPTLSARIRSGRVVGYEITVGAAGE
jgi:hypothetical protein